MAKQPKQQKDPAAPYNPLAKANLAKSIQTEILDCPLLPMTAAAGIVGAGVYAIYYVGKSSMYGMISPRDGTEPTWPIYVGKAIPEGGRKGGIKENASLSSDALAKRLMNHESSLTQACNLDPADFRFRFLVVDDIWIPLGENALIETFAPVWNAVVDGFGNNNPGKGRHKQQRSPWDTLHPGRPWAESLIPKTKKQHGVDMDVTPDEIVSMISSHLESTMTELAIRTADAIVQRRIDDAAKGDVIQMDRPYVVEQILASCPELPNEIVQACAAAALKAGSERTDVENAVPPHVSGRDSFGVDAIAVVKM